MVLVIQPKETVIFKVSPFRLNTASTHFPFLMANNFPLNTPFFSTTSLIISLPIGALELSEDSIVPSISLLVFLILILVFFSCIPNAFYGLLGINGKGGKKDKQQNW